MSQNCLSSTWIDPSAHLTNNLGYEVFCISTATVFSSLGPSNLSWQLLVSSQLVFGGAHSTVGNKELNTTLAGSGSQEEGCWQTLKKEKMPCQLGLHQEEGSPSEVWVLPITKYEWESTQRTWQGEESAELLNPEDERGTRPWVLSSLGKQHAAENIGKISSF